MKSARKNKLIFLPLPLFKEYTKLLAQCSDNKVYSNIYYIMNLLKSYLENHKT